MRARATLVGSGAVLTVVAGLFGGRGAVLGGAAAVAAQLAAVAVLRPAMSGPQPGFMGRWLLGMAIRAGTLAALLLVAATHRAAMPLLETSLGFLGVLLPLLFFETRFLK
ncbi:MAG TPA: hypothetical protein VGA20_04725 [Gemmatimonadales bacterium]